MRRPKLILPSLFALITLFLSVGAACSGNASDPGSTSLPTTSAPSSTSSVESFIGSAKYEDSAGDAVGLGSGTVAPDLKVGADLVSVELSSDGQALTMTFTHANPLPQEPLLSAQTGDLRIMVWRVPMDSDSGYTLVTLTLTDKWEVEVSSTTLGDHSESTLDVVPHVDGRTLTLAIPLTALGWIDSPFKWHGSAFWSLRGSGDVTSDKKYWDVLPGEGPNIDPNSPDVWVDFPQSGAVGQSNTAPGTSDSGRVSTEEEYFDATTAIGLVMADATEKVDGWGESEAVSDQEFLDALSSIEEQYQAALLLSPPEGLEEPHRYFLSSLAHYNTAVALMWQAIAEEDGAIMEQSKAEWDAGYTDLQVSTDLMRDLLTAQ